MTVHLLWMCVIMPKNTSLMASLWPCSILCLFFVNNCLFFGIFFQMPDSYLHVAQSYAFPQNNYQTTTAYSSCIYHSKCIHYHADWAIILCNGTPISKSGPFISVCSGIDVMHGLEVPAFIRKTVTVNMTFKLLNEFIGEDQVCFS